MRLRPAVTPRPTSPTRWISTAVVAITVTLSVAFSVALPGGRAANAVDEPTVPEPVATYFSSGLIPRLADLYGPGKKAGSGIDFDATTKVGDIHRLFAWTPQFLAGKKTDTPTQLTNNWVAPITVENQIVGLATVWINPASDDPELANFDLGPGLVTALAAAPKATVLIRDDSHSAWFASDGATLTPLVSGTSGIATATTIDRYRETLSGSGQSTPDAAGSSNGLGVAALVLGVVVVLLAIFVLLPLRRRRSELTEQEVTVADPAPPVDEPASPVVVVEEPAPAAPAAPAETQGKKPAVRKPAAAKPAAAKQAAAKPAVRKPIAAKPPATKPAAERSAAAKPAAAKTPTPRTPPTQKPKPKPKSEPEQKPESE